MAILHPGVTKPAAGVMHTRPLHVAADMLLRTILCTTNQDNWLMRITNNKRFCHLFSDSDAKRIAARSQELAKHGNLIFFNMKNASKNEHSQSRSVIGFHCPTPFWHYKSMRGSLDWFWTKRTASTWILAKRLDTRDRTLRNSEWHVVINTQHHEHREKYYWNVLKVELQPACNCAHRSTNTGGLALQHALKRQPGHHGGSWSHQSGGNSTSGHTICDGQGWTTVESQPTKPKEAATQDDERDIGRAQILLHMPTWSQNSTSDETRHTWADVNHGSTSKVQSSHLANPAARAPNPVAKRGIDQQWPKSQHDAVGTETHAFYQGSRDNGRRNDCKGQLECSKDKGWEAGVTPHLHVQVHPKAVVKVTDERTVVSEGPWKSKDYPSQSHNAHGHDAHHHGVDDVRVSDQAAVEEAKPCCHQEHKCRWGQDPGNCTCVHGIFCQSWVGHLASEQ